MEWGNFSAAASFGSAPAKFGVFSTFLVSLKMIILEITMACLNNYDGDVLSHFLHSGGMSIFHY